MYVKYVLHELIRVFFAVNLQGIYSTDCPDKAENVSVSTRRLHTRVKGPNLEGIPPPLPPPQPLTPGGLEVRIPLARR